MPSDRYLIKLQVTGSGNQVWKMTWQDPAYPDRHYNVDADYLQDVAKTVRDALQAVVDSARAGKSVGRELKELARRGAELQTAIFSGEGEGVLKANVIKNDYLPSRLDWMILVSVDQRVYIPWGLVYGGDAERLPDNPTLDEITPEVYSHFWCLKYQVAALHEVIDPTFITKPRANNEVQMLAIVNQLCWDSVRNRVSEDELKLLDDGLLRGLQPIASSSGFFSAWKRLHQNLDVLYLYCHANGSKLALGGEDDITVTKFRQIVAHDPPQTYPVCLVFLNGCQTAIGADKGGFLNATCSLGFCGFIGTEAKVPDLFAMRFATDFFSRLLYEDKTVAEIMDNLRREHWPLSLVYSTCCHPLFKIKRASTAPINLPKLNLSREPLQAERML
jgi:hypothetical protein